MAQVPQVRVGIMNEPIVEFVLNNYYLVNGERVTGNQLVQCVERPHHHHQYPLGRGIPAQRHLQRDERQRIARTAEGARRDLAQLATGANQQGQRHCSRP